MTKVTYVASKKFKELPDSEKSKYLSKAKISRNNINQLSQEQKKAFFINSLKFQNALIKKRMKKFYGMSHSEQERFLKAEAARIKKIRAMAKHNKQHKKKPVPSPEDIKLRMQCYLETIDAQTRAQMEEYRKRLKEKLES
ncbi:hypothetical protein P0136_11235 [Lentisphaerota bacterium ZTH]|nr:hypothetical protein JYG24_11245 [Lentisphaerota bacterium]WET05931.1 hypothetical protein P0136_11235 [Lentisphaerota bacterium ZTH]